MRSLEHFETERYEAMPEELPTEVDPLVELVDLVTTISATINELTDLNDRSAQRQDELTTSVDEIVVHQSRQLRKTQRALRWAVIGLLADVTLTLLTGFVVRYVSHNSDRIDVQQQQLGKVQHSVSSQSLCPLYGLFLDSYRPEALPSTRDRGEYDKAFTIIEDGAKALGCQHVKRGRA